MKTTLNLLEKTLICTTGLICLAVLFLSGYSLVDISRIYKQVHQDGFDERQNRTHAYSESDSPAENNWIVIDDTGINYQIMQGKDNEEYLNKDNNGEFSLAGSIFLDCRSSADFNDNYSIIYGHHMNGRSMFGELDGYYDENFFKSHQTGRIIVQGKERDLAIFAISVEDATDFFLYDPQNKMPDDILEHIRPHALYFDAKKKHTNHLIALSTCTSQHHSSKRTMIFGWLSE